MKVPKQKSSFGIPEEMRKAQEESRSKQEQVEPDEAKEKANDMSDGFEVSDDANHDNDDILKPSLKDLGIEITPEDINSLIMRNTFEKTVTVYKCPYTDTSFDVCFRALSSEDLNLIDSILMEQTKDEVISIEGFAQRKTLLNLAFSVKTINGKALVKVIKDKDDNPLKDKTAIEAYKVLSKMNPLILDKMQRVCARLVLACRAILEDPTSPLLTRP